jgi:hypothetical protein
MGVDILYQNGAGIFQKASHGQLPISTMPRVDSTLMGELATAFVEEHGKP